MSTISPVFAQVMSRVHREQFRRCVRRYNGDRRVRGFSCRHQFLAMAFAQMTFRDGLRDIESCINSRPQLLYHMGFRQPVARSTLADANEVRDFRIYAELAQLLIPRARRLYAGDPLGVDLSNTTYALDSTTVSVSLGLFPWARFRGKDGGIKIHTQLDLRGPIPSCIYITEQRVNDLNFLDIVVPEPQAVYIMDRGYAGLERLHRFHRCGAFFVVRFKENFDFVRSRSLPRLDSRVRSDQLGHPRNRMPRKHYPDLIRRVRYFDPENPVRLTLLTNMMHLSPVDIAELYRHRWQVELFFRWIKQNLRIRHFYGTSLNAVQTQVWIAVCVYLLIAIIHRELDLTHSLHRTLQILSVNPFEKVPLQQLLTESARRNQEPDFSNQLLFNDF
jgi:hypothetical protein